MLNIVCSISSFFLQRLLDVCLFLYEDDLGRCGGFYYNFFMKNHAVFYLFVSGVVLLVLFLEYVIFRYAYSVCKKNCVFFSGLLRFLLPLLFGLCTAICRIENDELLIEVHSHCV